MPSQQKERRPSSLAHYFVALKKANEDILTFWVAARSRQGAILQAQRFAGEPAEIIDVTIHPGR